MTKQNNLDILSDITNDKIKQLYTNSILNIHNSFDDILNSNNKVIHNKIPKIFHFIWISDDFMLENNNILSGHAFVINSYKKNNINFDIKVWTNKNVSELIFNLNNMYIIALLTSNKISLVQKTDIIRMIILQKYGGIYVDLDTICINDFDDLLNNNFFVAEEKAKKRSHMNNNNQVAHDMFYINNTVIGSTKNNVIINKYLDLIKSTKNENRISYGPNLLETALGFFDNSYYTLLSDDFFFVKNYFTELDTSILTKNTKIIHFYGGTNKNE